MSSSKQPRALPAPKSVFSTAASQKSMEADLRDADDLLLPVINSETATELLDSEDGWVIGARGNRLLRFQTEMHMVTIGSTGSGKGTSVSIPNMLMHKGSAFLLEMAGTTYRETANFRRNVLKQNVYLIDPWDATGDVSDSLNLLDALDPNSIQFYNDVQAFSRTLLEEAGENQPRGSDAYFGDTSKELLDALLIYVKTDLDVEDEDRHLPYLMKLSSSFGTPRWNELMEVFRLDSGVYSDLLNKVGAYYSGRDTENVRSIYSTMSKKFSQLMDPAVSKLLKNSTFSLDELRSGNATVYLVFNSVNDMSGAATFLRLFVDRVMAARPNLGDGGRGFKKTSSRLLVMLDEFTQLGKMANMRNYITTSRQQGVTIWPLFQDKGILEEIYGVNIANSIMGQAGVVQVLYTDEPKTLEYISERMGKRIVYIPQIQHGTNWGTNSQRNWNETITVGNTKTISDVISGGTSVTWSDAVTHTNGESVNQTDTIGTGSQQGSSTGSANSTGQSTNTSNVFSNDYQPRDDLKLRDISFYNPSDDQVQKSSRGYNSGQATSIQNTQSHNESYSTSQNQSSATGTGRNWSEAESRTLGGGNNDGWQKSEANAKSQNVANSTGGSKGDNEGGTYSITYAPQIIPALDSWQIPDVLINENQILFIRSKTSPMLRIIERKANFYEIPMLLNRTQGPRVIEAPQLIGNLLPLDAQRYALPAPLELIIPEFVKYQPQYQLSEMETVQNNVGSFNKQIVDQYIETQGKKLTPAEVAQKNKNFLNAASGIQALSVATLRAANKAEMTSEAAWNLMHSQSAEFIKIRTDLVNGFAKLQQKRSFISEYEKSLDIYQKNLQQDLEYEQKFTEKVSQYKSYMDTISEIRQGWRGLFPVGMKPIEAPLDKRNQWTVDSVREYIDIPISLFSGDVPTIDESPVCPHRKASLELSLPMPANQLKNLKADMRGDVQLTLSQLDAIISNKSEFIEGMKHQEGSEFLAACLNLTTEECVQARQKFIGFVESNTFKLMQKFDSDYRELLAWESREFSAFKDYSDKMKRFEMLLSDLLNAGKDLEAKMDEHWANLEKIHHDFDEANKILESRRKGVHNDMCRWPVWEELAAQDNPIRARPALMDVRAVPEHGEQYHKIQELKGDDRIVFPDIKPN